MQPKAARSFPRASASGPRAGLASGTIPITAVKSGAEIEHAYLYWMTVGTADPSVLLNGKPVAGTLVGASRNPCDPVANAGATRVYRADVASLVSGNGSYSVADVGLAPGAAEGASLVLVTSQPGALTTNHVVIQDGALTALPGETITKGFPLTTAIALR